MGQPELNMAPVSDYGTSAMASLLLLLFKDLCIYFFHFKGRFYGERRDRDERFSIHSFFFLRPLAQLTINDSMFHFL